MHISKEQSLGRILQKYLHRLSAANKRKMIKFRQMYMPKIKGSGTIIVKTDAKNIKCAIC